MKHKFEELYEFIKLDDRLSPWARETSLSQRIKELEEEIQEMKTELKKENYTEFSKELGDVLWDVLCLIAKAESKKLLVFEELLPQIHEKFKRRKPFLTEGRKVSKEEELEIWRRVKEQEKLK